MAKADDLPPNIPARRRRHESLALRIKVKDISELPTTLRQSLRQCADSDMHMSLPGVRRLHVTDEAFQKIRSSILKCIHEELGYGNPETVWSEWGISWYSESD